MESRENTPSEPRLVKIEEQIKNLNAEIKEQRNIFNKRKELLTASKKKPDEFLRAYDDTMRKYVYFYDYLPALLSVLQIAFSSKKEVIMKEVSEIDRSADDFQKKFYHEMLELNEMAKNLYDLEEKTRSNRKGID